MTYRISLLLLLFSSIATTVLAQRPAPNDEKPRKILLMGGVAHVGNGTLIENSAIGLADGKISFIMDARGFKPDPRSFDTLIYLEGKHVYPGFISIGSILGLSDLELVRATNDFRESGSVNPGARTLIAYNTDSRVIPTVRDNGILTAQVAPQGGLISGTSSVVQLDAWNYEDAVVKTDDGIWVNWPSMRVFKGSWADPEDEQRERNERDLQNLLKQFEEASSYAKDRPAVKNSHLEAMKGLFDGSKSLFVRCDYAREIVEAVQASERYGMRLVIVGGADSWRVATLLKEKNVPVVIERTHSLPYREDEDVDLPYKLPALLKKSGVLFAITDQGFWQHRNLPFQAGTAAGYGLSREEAVSSITLNAAKILGIDSFCGSLEEGKDATLFVSKGDALEMTGNSVMMAFIQGREIVLDSYQKELYRRYLKKYGLKEQP
ncbi:MAG: hypothetical protein RLZZ630_1103 [Bacteroidota bacterium]|jgi:imidazolonepropionase-like amidohydrolase